nr:synaptosomal-associated protein 29-like isoform X2 [Drosophila suzukii]
MEDESAQGLASAEKKRAVEQRTLDSTKKSLGLLYEAQEIGNATAVELGKQREQLDKATAQLDEMNSTLHINKNQINRLKIESQNELLDNLNPKIEDVDLQVHKQNQDLTKLLKK